METERKELGSLLRGSPWYESAVRGSRAERSVVLWLRLGRHSRVEGFVGQVLDRGGQPVGDRVIGGTVWTSEYGPREPVLDERRRSLEEGWSEVERRLMPVPVIVGHRLASLRSRLLQALPPLMQRSFARGTLVDLHEAASLLRRSRIAETTAQGTLLEVRSASLVDLGRLAGETISEELLETDDLRAASVVTAIWSKVLLPRFAKLVPSETAETHEEVPPVETPPAPSRGQLPAHIAAILEMELPEESPDHDDPLAEVPVAASIASSSYDGVPDTRGWRLQRGGRELGAQLEHEALARAILTDLDGVAPDTARALLLVERVIAHLPSGRAFSISADDLRAILD